MVRMIEAIPRRNAAEHAVRASCGAIALCALLAGGPATGTLRAQETGWSTQGRFLAVSERRESLRTPTGIRPCWFALADRPDESMPGVLLLEPRATDRGASRERARLIASLGTAVLVISVDPRDEATTATLGETRAAFDWLRSQRATSDQPIAVLGIGTASPAAVQLACSEPRVAACAIDRRVAELRGFGAAQMRSRLEVLPTPLEGRSPLGSTAADALLRFFGETILPGLSVRETPGE